MMAVLHLAGVTIVCYQAQVAPLWDRPEHVFVVMLRALPYGAFILVHVHPGEYSDGKVEEQLHCIARWLPFRWLRCPEQRVLVRGMRGDVQGKCHRRHKLDCKIW